MAITIQTAPSNSYSAQGDLLFVVVDIAKANDPVTYVDYKYIADVYVGATMVTRLKAVPRPDNKMGIFNIGTIVRSYLAVNFSPAANQLRAQEMGEGQFRVAVTVKFGEEYGFTTYTNLTVDSERYYFNHYNGRLVGVQSILGPYQNKALTVRPFLTSSYGGAFNLVPYFNATSSDITLTFNSFTNGTYQSSFTQDIIPSEVFALQQLNLSPAAINTASPGFIHGGITSYQVLIGSGSMVEIKLDCESRFEVYTLHFLNRFGGFESKSFNKVSRKTIDIEKTDFGKLGYNMDSSGFITYYNPNKVYHETRSVYASQYSEKMVLNSEILTDAEYIWLSDLILSPLVYIEVEGYFLPITIKSNNYEFKKTINDKLTNLTLNIEFGEQYNAQYR